MGSTKIVLLLIAASVLVAAVAGIAFAQFTGALTSGNSASQTLQGASGTSYPYPQQGYYPYGSAQYGNPSRYGRGMCGCWW